MNEDFEDIVSDLEDIDYRLQEVPVVVNACISGGIQLHKHNDDCDCDTRIFCITLKYSDPSLEETHLAIPVNSPLGQAILSGEFAQRCQQKVDEIA